MHKNCISVGEYYCDVYQDLFTALIEHHVDLVLSGHDHSYQRSKEIATGDGCGEVVVDDFDPDCVADSADTVRAGAGTVFVVAAAGGAELYDVHRDDPEAEYFAAAMGRNTPGSTTASRCWTSRRSESRFASSVPRPAPSRTRSRSSAGRRTNQAASRKARSRSQTRPSP